MEMVDAEEKKWRAQNDARTIAEYWEIQSDPKRVKAAKPEALKMIKEKQAQIKGLQMFTKKAKTL